MTRRIRPKAGILSVPRRGVHSASQLIANKVKDETVDDYRRQDDREPYTVRQAIPKVIPSVNDPAPIANHRTKCSKGSNDDARYEGIDPYAHCGQYLCLVTTVGSDVRPGHYNQCRDSHR